MELSEAIKKAAEENGITGVMKLKDHCGLSYERTVKVWEGKSTAKIRDIETIMSSLGYVVSFSKKGS